MVNVNKIACHCHGVTYKKIYEALEKGAETYEDLQRMTHCGTGCKKCKDFILCLMRDWKEEHG